MLSYQILKDKGLILFDAIAGSKAYGTNIPTSDEDRRYIYILPEDYILGNKYIPQVSDETNDVVGYEIKRFLELLEGNNPNIMEFLNFPQDCIQYKHHLFDLILEKSDKFITKKLEHTLGGYAKQQITKATGQDKKSNWEKQRVKRKTPFDFCYVAHEGGSKPLQEWLDHGGYKAECCGLTKIPHMRDMFYVYYDGFGHHAGQEEGYVRNPDYKGIINSEKSNQLSLSSIPKGERPVATLYYNEDGYSMHCKEYREYQDWLENKNETRWMESKTHGQKIDAKNIMHLVRLLQMSREVAEGKGLVVRRENREELLAIRRGEVNLQEIISWGNKEMEEIKALYKASNLPDSVDPDMIHTLLVSIRRRFYEDCSGVNTSRFISTEYLH